MPSKNCVFTYMVTSRKNKNKKKKKKKKRFSMISKLGMSNSTQVANRIKAKKSFWGIEQDYQRDALVVFEFFFIKLWSKLLKKWWCHKFPSKIHEREWYLIKTKEKVGWYVGPMEMECLFLILIYQSVPDFEGRKYCTLQRK